MIATELFKWSDDFSVNIQAVDDQHKILVDLINQLHLAIIEHHGKATAGEVLDRLSEYISTHFTLEESLMRQTHFPEFEIHKHQHDYMIGQVQALQQKLDKENRPIAFELLYFLKKWLIQHINESDKRFGAHFVKASRDQDKGLIKDGGPAIRKDKWWKR